MAFDYSAPRHPVGAPARRMRIAVVGSGVSGLAAAWLLSKAHEVVVYEKDRRLGGHANTVEVDTPAGPVGVDAGFIVFNKPNYPNLTALFEHLGVSVEETNMSFAASIDDGRIEYSGQGLASVFANRESVCSPSHWSMICDLLRFNREARAAVEDGLDEEMTLGAFLVRHRYSKAFVDRFLAPMAAAIWSTPSLDILEYPAASLFRFYANHGLLQVANNPRWNTVSGGSRVYVEKISATMPAAARLGSGAARIARGSGGVIVTDAQGHADRFDHVVLATHADAALAMIERPTTREEALLKAFRYQPNRAVVHSDSALMPKRRRVWSSWNYMGGEGAPSVSYWMNRLQNLRCVEDIFVTLNPARPPREDAVIAAFDYDHPMFNVEAMRAQRELWSLQGDGGIWFCGAHFGAGFHEDGLQAGLAVAEDLGGVARPWTVPNDSGRIWRRKSAPLALAAE
ncbi:MAG TPA: NAD/FAD-binding protein [Parvularcula sp.]|nr:NAD/FAD-binding protein [Parvularcula sp.]HBS34879.1 NAD/FAD-binding protein [Parvularcula sp.]